MPSLFPHQLTGAVFLAGRNAALLADEQRVGKTAAAIAACDLVLAKRILVVTTATARGQWAREFRVWSHPRQIQVLFGTFGVLAADAEVVIVGWSAIAKWANKLRSTRWDVLLLDESHNAKNPATERTQAVFGNEGIYHSADRVWCLSGTPAANSPADLYPMLWALAPERIEDTPDYDHFCDQYCVSRFRPINNRWIRIIKGGKNIELLRERLDGFWLRRTQQDVGIGKPIFDVFALTVDKVPEALRDNADAQAVFDALETGETKSLEMHLGPLRRLTGELKAHAAAEAAAEMLETYAIDKLVLMGWHTDVLDIMWTKLVRFGVVGIDGRTPAKRRTDMVERFQTDAASRVFVGQIQAAGEAIDLSAAAELWFIESSFTPKDMAQAAMRITNHSQKRQALVRVCALAGSLDEAIQAILTRKVASIRQLMETE